MIALDTNVLVRVLVEDDEDQARFARALLGELTPEHLGFICREVVVELVWVLERTYGLSRDQIATALEGLVATEGLQVESADDVAHAALRYRQGGIGFSDLMIAAAARRSGATRLYTFDRKVARLEDCTLLGEPVP
ncbi:MAG: type II toxin-antitoxin system VapC family toxin [Gammaproteobacteria bacterium]|nr:type II toxin-antitoxin system VapC family toxin [Gammaproteobacteria bacterium]MDE0273435.1 type II toxin-antitoxin system VapC family toxin [Gammaproteobacteria bacterium]